MGYFLHPRLALVTAPSGEPVTLEEAKAHARIDFDGEDTLVSSLIVAARRLVEKRLSRSLVDTTWDFTIDDFGCSRLKFPVAAVQSVISVSYMDSGGNSVVLSSTAYRLSPGSPGYLSPVPGATWPVVSPWSTGAVTIRLVAGYGSTSEAVPENLKLAIKMLVSSWYMQREHLSEGTLNLVPDSVDALLDCERWF